MIDPLRIAHFLAAMSPSRALLLVVGFPLLTSFALAAPPADQLARGKKVYDAICVACHQPTAQGVPSVFPPLAKSDYLMADKQRSIRIVAKGLTGKITVNGKDFDSAMPPPGLKPEQIADVLTYVRNNFGNSGDAVSVDEVNAVLKAEK